jgi:hypothetical protein
MYSSSIPTVKLGRGIATSPPLSRTPYQHRKGGWENAQEVK